MAFPNANITDRDGGNNTSDVTSHIFTLPGNIVSGNLLLMFATYDPPAGTITWPGGWTQVYSFGTGDFGTGQLYKRTADGTEGTTITVTTGTAASSVHTSYRVTATSLTVEAATFTGTNTAIPDPPNLTPTWGTKDTLWFAVTQYGSGTRFVDVYPTNYTNGRNDNWDDSGGVGQGTAIRQLNATSENPGIFTLNQNWEWLSATVAVEPPVDPPQTGKVRVLFT